ncbi:MAG: PTS sugar transporter subunit IIA [bacterium]
MQLTVHDASRLLAVSEKTIYRWIKQGVLPVYRVNEQLRFNRAELLEWATSRRVKISPDIFIETEAESSVLPSLVDALTAGGVVYRLSGADQPAVLRAVVEAMKLPEEVDREFLYRVLLARESLGSTGIGDGIAIPHVRNPVVLHVNKPMITLCFLDQPINFGALDQVPVSILFALISPTVKAHLHMLSRLGFVLQHAEFKAALKRQASRDELMALLAAAEGTFPAMIARGGTGEPAVSGADAKPG